MNKLSQQSSKSYSSSDSNETSKNALPKSSGDVNGKSKGKSKDDEVDLEEAHEGHARELDEQKSAWQRFLNTAFDDWWMWEILSLFWAILVIIIIVILLLLYNNRPQDDWPGRISLNSTVALLCTIAKLGFINTTAAALGQLRWNWYSQPRFLSDWATFDDASRGSPYGSAALMWKIRGFHLAPIGAFISLAAIFFTSLTQQALTYVTDEIVLAGGEASMPRTFRYETSYTNPFTVDGDPVLSSFTSPSDSDMLAAVAFVSYNGSSTVKPGFQLDSTCSTATCYYGIYSSLAACSRCEAIDDQIKSDCTSGICTYSLPSTNSTASLLSTGNVFNTTNDEPIYTTLNTSSVSGLGSDFGIFNFTTLFTNYTTRDTNDKRVTLTSGATSATVCHVSLCIATYNSSFVNGTLTDTVLNTTSLSSANRTLNGTLTEIPMPFPNLPSNATLSISPGSLTILGRQVRNFYSGSVVIAPGQGGEGGISTVSAVQYGIGYSSNTMQALYRNNTVNTTLAATNLAETISNIIRSQGPRSSYQAGNAYVTTSVLRVDWWWIIYPVALQVLVGAFLLATILRTKYSGVQTTWKSSPIALLLHGLEAREGALKNMMSLRKLHEMSALSRRVRVKLRRTGERTRLVSAMEEPEDASSDEDNGDERTPNSDEVRNHGRANDGGKGDP